VVDGACRRVVIQRRDECERPVEHADHRRCGSASFDGSALEAGLCDADVGGDLVDGRDAEALVGQRLTEKRVFTLAASVP
jgi:hypothetical protein